jgi:hypothetical protein
MKGNGQKPWWQTTVEELAKTRGVSEPQIVWESFQTGIRMIAGCEKGLPIYGLVDEVKYRVFTEVNGEVTMEPKLKVFEDEPLELILAGDVIFAQPILVT